MLLRITLLALLILHASAAEEIVYAATHPEMSGLRLEVVTEFVGAAKNNSGPNRTVILSIRSWVKNVSKKRLTVPSTSYDGLPSCWTTGGDSYEICFTVGKRVVEGQVMTPSPSRFFPVTLEPGEATELPEYRADVGAKDEIRKVVVEFTVDRDYGKKQAWWFGELRREVEIRPNQSSQPTPPSRRG